MDRCPTRRFGTWLLAAVVGSVAAIPHVALGHERSKAARQAAEADEKAAGPAAKSRTSKAAPDRSGKRRVGIASFYARRFAGQTMANGEPMDPQDDNAASKTLPLGTRARVTNLENGRSATVTIEDRGPYVPGRIIDVSPATARELGIDREEGLAKVAVQPIELPDP